MNKITPCLWFDGTAEEAAKFYTSVFPDGKITKVSRSPAETPSGPEGMVLTVEFTMAGQPFIGLNGGPEFTFNESVSFRHRLRRPGRGGSVLGGPGPGWR